MYYQLVLVVINPWSFVNPNSYSIKTHSRVSVAKKDVRHTNVFFTGTAKSPFSTPYVSITATPISIKFIYFISSIYMILHTKCEENRISSGWDMRFWKLPNFFTFSSSHRLTTITLSQEKTTFSKWISFKFGTLIRHNLAYLHLKCGDV